MHPCLTAGILRASLLLMAAALGPAGAQGSAAAAQGASKVHRNVYAAGGEVRPSATVEGDFVAAGGRVTIDHPIGADATLAGGAIDVRAAVADDLRAVGGDVSIEASVGGEVFAAGGNVAVRTGAILSGTVRLYGANVTMAGRVEGDLTAAGQKVVLDGEVRGDTHLAAEQIELGPNARVAGLTYASPREPKRAPGAVISGVLKREEPRGADKQPARAQGDWRGRPAFWVGGAFSYLALLACAAVFLLVAPLFGVQAPQRITAAPWTALAIGFGSLVTVPMLAVLLFLTLLGIPLGIMVMSLYPVLLLAGFIVGVLFVAGLLPAALRKPAPASFKAAMGWFALALLLVMVAARVPVVGTLLMGLVSLAGMGACVLELHRRRKRPPTPAAAAGEPPVPRLETQER